MGSIKSIVNSPQCRGLKDKFGGKVEFPVGFRVGPFTLHSEEINKCTCKK